MSIAIDVFFLEQLVLNFAATGLLYRLMLRYISVWRRLLGSAAVAACETAFVIAGALCPGGLRTAGTISCLLLELLFYCAATGMYRFAGWWKLLSGYVGALWLLGSVMLGTASVLRLSLATMPFLPYCLLALFLGSALEWLLRLLARALRGRRLTYGIVVYQAGKYYFFKGYCDTGNRLRDARGKGVWLLRRGRFELLFPDGPFETLQFVDAAGSRQQVMCRRCAGLRVVGERGVVYEAKDVSIGCGEFGADGSFDLLMPAGVFESI